MSGSGRLTGRVEPSVPRLALSKAEAAAALGVSIDFFEQHVMPELRVVRRGRRRLIPVRELDRWLGENAALALEDAG
jgi:excisionase family DNA binding protein